MSSSPDTHRAPHTPLNSSFSSSNHPPYGSSSSHQPQNHFRLPPIRTLSLPQTPGPSSSMALGGGGIDGMHPPPPPPPLPMDTRDSWSRSSASTPMAPPSGPPAGGEMRERRAPSVAGSVNSDSAGPASLHPVSPYAHRSSTSAPSGPPLPPPPTSSSSSSSAYPYPQQSPIPPSTAVGTAPASSPHQSYVTGQKRPHPTSARQQPHASVTPTPPPHHSSSHYHHHQPPPNAASSSSHSQPYYSGPPPSQQPGAPPSHVVADQQPPRPIVPYPAHGSGASHHPSQPLPPPPTAPAPYYGHQGPPPPPAQSPYAPYPNSYGPPPHHAPPPTDHYGRPTTGYGYPHAPPPPAHHSHTQQQALPPPPPGPSYGPSGSEYPHPPSNYGWQQQHPPTHSQPGHPQMGPPPPGVAQPSSYGAHPSHPPPGSYGVHPPPQQPHYASGGPPMSGGGPIPPPHQGPPVSTGAHGQHLLPPQQNHTGSGWAPIAPAPPPLPHPSTRPPTNAGPDKPIAQLVEHCQRIIAFANHYAALQRQGPPPYQPNSYQPNPYPYPQPHEIKEMVARAEAMVVLLIQLGEEAKPYRKLQAQQREQENAKRRKIGDDKTNATAVNGAGKAADKDFGISVEQKRKMFGENTEALEQAEKDMRTITQKRTLSQGGVLPSSKTKYKKRSRATPPGKCHSCFSTETPEWRRGPDGARTLCNACGLHYAKMMKRQAGSSVTLGMLQASAQKNGIGGGGPQTGKDPAPKAPSSMANSSAPGPSSAPLAGSESRKEVEENSVGSSTAAAQSAYHGDESRASGKLPEKVEESDEEDEGSEDGDDDDDDRASRARSPILPYGAPSSSRPVQTSYISNVPTSGWGRTSSSIPSSGGGGWARAPMEDHRPRSP
ncbi:hypothetical protein FRB90_003485, partial [Tulasnella sp. 427]